MDMPSNVKTLQHFIGGEWINAEGDNTFEVLNPLDDSLYIRAAKGNGNDIRKAIVAAKSTFPTFKETTPTERERWLLRVAELMEERKAQIIDCLIDEIGSPISKAMFEFNKGLTMLRAAAGMCRNVRGETIPSDAPGKFSMSIREPLGVVAIITPFNVPLIKTTRLVSNALAVGNTVVHLPSEMAPHLSIIMAELVSDAGIPAGAYNVVTGNGAEIGDDLTNTVDPIIGVWTGDGDTLIFRSNGDLILDGYTGGWINNDGNADFNSVNQSYTLISVEDEIEFKDPFLNVKFSNDFNSFTSPGLPGTATRQ